MYNINIKIAFITFKTTQNALKTTIYDKMLAYTCKTHCTLNSDNTVPQTKVDGRYYIKINSQYSFYLKPRLCILGSYTLC